MTAVWVRKAVERSARGLIAQSFRQSKTNDALEGSACRYRGDNGRKCAVGHMLSDLRYDPSFEGVSLPESLAMLGRYALSDSGQYLNRTLRVLSAIALSNDGPLDFGLDADVNLALFSQLQQAHDGASDPKQVQNRLAHALSNFGYNDLAAEVRAAPCPA